MRIEEKKFSEIYLQCCAEMDLACFNLDLITLEKLAEEVWQWYKKLWILEFMNLQTVRFKLNFQVENSQVFL